MKPDRFLTAILIGIAILVITSLAVFFLRRDSLQYGEETSPEGVVGNYIIALHKGDYERAYTYLADLDNKPSLETFSAALASGQVNPNSDGVTVQKTTFSGKQAFVSLAIYYGSSDPFSSGGRNIETSTLIRQGESWKIKSMPYFFWSYDWYQEPPKP